MSRLHLVRLLCALSVAVLTSAHEARADEQKPAEMPETAAAEPLSSPPSWDFELGAKVAYTTPPIAGGTSPFGIGFGGRAGFLISHVYVGLTVVDYFGGKDVDVTETALLYGAELGYDLRLAEVGAGYFKLRPRVGGGGVSIFRTDPSLAATATTGSSGGRGRSVDVVSRASGSSSSSSNVQTVSAFYAEPGATLLFVTGPFFLGLDANVLVIPAIIYSGAASTTWLAYGAQGQSGFRF